MPLYLCKCSHEFESSRKDPKCDWCGETELKVLEEETPLEKMVNDGSLEKIVMEFGLPEVRSTGIPRSVQS
jgi:hypothetical protein